MLQPKHKPDPVMLLGVLAIVLLVVSACVHVDGSHEEDDCDEVGLSAVTATPTSKPVDRLRTSVSKAPAARERTARTPSPSSSTTPPGHTRPHGGRHHDLDLCD